MRYPVKAFVVWSRDELEREVRCIKFEYVDEEIDVGQGVMIKTSRRIKKYATDSERYHTSTVIDEWKKEGAVMVNENLIIHPHDGTAIAYIIIDADKPSRKKREDDS